jgi:hypothetical protein
LRGSFCGVADPDLDQPVQDSGYDLYSRVLQARADARVSQPLGDESAMDLLAMRDHVLGLEAELVNARAEAAHWRAMAHAARKELGDTVALRALRSVRLARRYKASFDAHRAAQLR